MATSRDEPDPFRPALVTLTNDVRERVEELRSGLSSEARVLEWFQELTIRSLGLIDERVYWDLSRQYRGKQGVLLASLLRPAARRGEMRRLNEQAAQKVRERLVANYALPAHREAFRELRADATEYVDAAGEGDAHNPDRQRFIAMRPALDELETWQDRALEELIDGFGARGEILDWGNDVILATHGEISQDWVTRVYNEDSTVDVLTGERPEHARGRRLFAAYHLLPHYRAGVRVLSGRAGELADESTERTEASFA